MTTPLDIITLALKDVGVLGVGATASPEDANDAFTTLQWLLAQWQRKRWLVWHLEDLSVVSTGAQSYTVGPGGDINTATRPDKIEAAYLRQIVQSQPNQIDYPLEIISSREQYSRIALKQLTSFSSYLFYNSGYPLGTIYPWPVAQASLYEIHILLKQILTQFSSLAQTISLPAEYLPALRYNLAVRLQEQYPDLAVQRPGLVALARDALNVLRESNTQIATLTMPTELVRAGVYNPYSDQIR